MSFRFDEVKSFWVVTLPNTRSAEVIDICFKADVAGMMRQVLGGLREDQVVGVFVDEVRAKALARKILSSLSE